MTMRPNPRSLAEVRAWLALAERKQLEAAETGPGLAAADRRP